MLSNDGKVAQQGSYTDLSQDPNGAFTKLMEWQMSGGENNKEASENSVGAIAKDVLGGYDGDVIEAMAEERSEEGEVEEAGKSKPSGDESSGKPEK